MTTLSRADALPVYAAYLKRVLRRAVLLWTPLRAALLLLALATGLHPGMSLTGTLLLAVALAALCHIDARFMREPIFFANIGVPVWTPAAAGAAAAIAGELAIVLAAAVVQAL